MEIHPPDAVSAGAGEKQDAGAEDPVEHAGEAEELEVVLSVRAGHAAIRVQSSSSDPYIEEFDGLDMAGLAEKVPAVIERARAKRQTEPRAAQAPAAERETGQKRPEAARGAEAVLRAAPRPQPDQRRKQEQMPEESQPEAPGMNTREQIQIGILIAEQTGLGGEMLEPARKLLAIDEANEVLAAAGKLTLANTELMLDCAKYGNTARSTEIGPWKSR